jgi:hypothetical protein
MLSWQVHAMTCLNIIDNHDSMTGTNAMPLRMFHAMNAIIGIMAITSAYILQTHYILNLFNWSFDISFVTRDMWLIHNVTNKSPTTQLIWEYIWLWLSNVWHIIYLTLHRETVSWFCVRYITQIMYHCHYIYFILRLLTCCSMIFPHRFQKIYFLSWW